MRLSHQLRLLYVRDTGDYARNARMLLLQVSQNHLSIPICLLSPKRYSVRFVNARKKASGYVSHVVEVFAGQIMNTNGSSTFSKLKAEIID